MDPFFRQPRLRLAEVQQGFVSQCVWRLRFVFVLRRGHQRNQYEYLVTSSNAVAVQRLLPLVISAPGTVGVTVNTPKRKFRRIWGVASGGTSGALGLDYYLAGRPPLKGQLALTLYISRRLAEGRGRGKPLEKAVQ